MDFQVRQLWFHLLTLLHPALVLGCYAEFANDDHPL